MDEKVKKGLITTKNIFCGIAIFISAILVFVAGWLCVDKFICKNKVPSFMGYASLTVATGSMSGTIEEGDFIIIKNTKNYKIGDIVTFLHEGEKIPTTHRIIQITPEGNFITKGDANDTQDEGFVTQDEIFGEVISVWHEFGIVVGWLLNGGGYLYIISIILIVAIAIYLLKKPKETVSITSDVEGSVKFEPTKEMFSEETQKKRIKKNYSKKIIELDSDESNIIKSSNRKSK